MAGISDDLPKFRDELEVFKRIARKADTDILRVFFEYDSWNKIIGKKITLEQLEAWFDIQIEEGVTFTPISKGCYEGSENPCQPIVKYPQNRLKPSKYIDPKITDYDKAFYTNDF